ncbi:MAG TPA: ATP synthase F1 subunit epsilon [Thermoanaerobaculia bacterium]|nr:ATP synthase F1 subunit epsilon [Thermoanaerobaculia bacterium]
MALQLLVVTPERRVLEAEADEVELPGSQGYLGILPGHAPLITLLGTGVLSLRRGGSTTAYAVSAGFAEVSGDRVSVLADSAEAAGEIDAASAERERSKAEEEMKTAGVDTLDGIRSRLELAQARLAVARRPS